MDVYKLKPGPELDLLIAEKIMGWSGEGLKAAEVGVLWSPSTRIADAWEVVEKLELSIAPYEIGPMKWMASKTSYFIDSETESGETAPLAICRAALTAVTP